MGKKWNEQRLNLGYDCKELVDPNSVNYMVYTNEGTKKYFLSNSGGVPVEGGGCFKGECLNVIKYHDKTYAAFLLL